MPSREEQELLRQGKLTGSRVQKIMQGTWRAWNSVAAEMRDPKPFFTVDQAPNMPEALKWGQLTEPQAAARFWEEHEEYEIDNPRFLNWHDPKQTELYKYMAVSPDRMLRKVSSITVPGRNPMEMEWRNVISDTYSAGLELKCPYNGEVHAETIRQRILPARHKWQVYHGMYVAGLDEWWFASFDPRVTEREYQMFDLHVRAERTEMRRLEATLNEFLDGFTSGRDFTPRGKTARDFSAMF